MENNPSESVRTGCVDLADCCGLMLLRFLNPSHSVNLNLPANADDNVRGTRYPVRLADTCRCAGAQPRARSAQVRERDEESGEAAQKRKTKNEKKGGIFFSFRPSCTAVADVCREGTEKIDQKEGSTADRENCEYSVACGGRASNKMPDGSCAGVWDYTDLAGTFRSARPPPLHNIV